MESLKKDLWGESISARLWAIGERDNYYRSIENGDARGLVKVMKSIYLSHSEQVTILKSHQLYSPDVDYNYCMSDGERADVDGRYADAILFYGRAINSPPPIDPDIVMNLAHLYWRCIPDNPMRISFSIPATIINQASQLLSNTFLIFSRLFWWSNDHVFWKSFYKYSLEQNPIEVYLDQLWINTTRYWEGLINNGIKVLPKYEYIATCFPDMRSKYQTEINEFITKSIEYPTTKNLFIRNRINSFY